MSAFTSFINENEQGERRCFKCLGNQMKRKPCYYYTDTGPGKEKLTLHLCPSFFKWDACTSLRLEFIIIVFF